LGLGLTKTTEKNFHKEIKEVRRKKKIILLFLLDLLISLFKYIL